MRSKFQKFCIKMQEQTVHGKLSQKSICKRLASGFTLQCTDCSTSSIYHLQSEFWTSHHPTLLRDRSQQCETSLVWPSGSRSRDHRSYESVRCHLLLQAPQWPRTVWNTIQQRPLLLRKVKASLSDSVVSHRSRRPRTFNVSWFFVLPQWLPGCQTHVVMEDWGYLNGTKQNNQGCDQTGQQKAGWPNIDTLARRKMVIVVSILAASYLSSSILLFCHSRSRPCCQSYLKEAKYMGLNDFPAYCCWNTQDIQFKCCLVF